MDILDEGELVSVFMERSEKHFSNSSEKAVSFLKNGDFGATFDEDITVPVSMKKTHNGDYKVCSIFKLHLFRFHFISFHAY